MSGPAELWQAYDENCKPVAGVGLTRAEAYGGKLHAASQVWLWRHKDNTIEVLLQLRASDKRTWPSHWDISAAGHIDLNETPRQAAVRETFEEIGLSVKENDLSPMFVFHADYTDEGSGAIENEWQFTYELNLVLNKLFKFADGEVAEVKWISLDDLEKATQGKLTHVNKLVPHGDSYYSQLISYLKQKL
ncbi:MAG: hydrolase [Candidatus Saccharibacteria bacterium]|nr:hydrolase [Candidatus Saccharibacteria bacterium]